MSSITHRAAAVLLIAGAVLFLAANIVVGLAWNSPGFSWRTNNISDLGNVTCGIWDTTRPRYVCSPWHDAMNIAMITTGLLLIAGLLLTWRGAGPGRALRTGRAMMLAAAAGFALVGLFPADVDENLHLLAAVLIFFVGNAGLAVAGGARRDPAALVLGLLGLAGAVLFLAQRDLGLGLGGMERVAVFPLPAWACWAGFGLLRGTRSRAVSTTG